MTRRVSIAANRVIELPEWMFDVDEEDDDSEDTATLLQALDIDVGQIYR